MKLKDLKDNRIFIYEKPAVEGELPPHVERLRIRLLNFRFYEAVIGGVDDNKPNDSSLTANDTVLVKRYRDIKEDATILHEGKDREAEWQTFFLINFFCPLKAAVRMEEEDTHHTAHVKCYYDYFESAQSRPWTLFNKRGKTPKFWQDRRENLTEPKPDWVAFFQMSNSGAERIPGLARWRVNKDDNNATHDNFSYTTLAHLARHGVESNTAGLFRRKETSVVPSDYICFPWLIVEHKKTGGPALVEKCYCQAANAGTAAIMMLETLSKVVEADGQKTKDKDHIPPVVTITTVDAVVRVWITYSCDPSDSGGANYKMSCIWEGKMTVVSDLIKFQAILKNTHSWAMRDQRGRISAYIDLWKWRCKPNCNPTPSSTAGLAVEEADPSTAGAVDVSCPASSVLAQLSPGSSADDLSLGSLFQTPTKTGKASKPEHPLSDEESRASESEIERQQFNEEAQETEVGEEEEELVKEGPSRDSSRSVKPVSDAESDLEEPTPDEEAVSEESVSGDEPVSEGESALGEDSPPEKEPTYEEPQSSEGSTSGEPGTLEGPLPEEPLPATIVGSDGEPGNSELLPAKSMDKEKGIGVWFRYPRSESKRRAKLPHSWSNDIPSNTRPPVISAPGVVSAIPPASNASAGSTIHPPVATPSRVERVRRTAPDIDGLDARRGHGRDNVQQQAAPMTPGHPPFGALAVDGAGQASPADVWPRGIRFEFKVPASEGRRTPESTPSRPRRVNTTDFNNGVFSDFAALATSKMHLPGFSSAIPFTPPPSADNTPLKQGPAKTQHRPVSPCYGRGKSLQTLARATLPTPDPTPDEGSGPVRDRLILEVFADE